MTQEEKELLLKDLCARLPYGVKAYIKNWSKLDRKYYEGVYRVESIDPFSNHIVACSERSAVEVIVGYDDYEIKPYLFPLSNMTDEQQIDLTKFVANGIHGENILYDWYNKNHFDYRGLIPMDLSIDATGLNIY